jgi:TetR/AcrR family transcriptional repressor of nem operon
VTAAQREAAVPGGCPFGNFAAALPAGESESQCESFRLRLSGIFLEMEEAVKNCLVEGIERREFRSDVAPEDLAAFTVAAVQGFLMLTKVHRDPSRLDCCLKVILQLVRPA